MFSEPGAGSDLASLSTKAVRVDGGWSLSGQKVWTSTAQYADWAICLARTSTGARRHDGITYFLLDMKSPGIDVRPLRELTGEALFNEIFLTDVFVPDDCVVGEVDGGWKLARTTLANERVAMSSGSAFPSGIEEVLRALAVSDRADNPVLLARIGELVCVAQADAMLGVRATLARVSGTDPGAASSVRKMVGMHLRQDAAELAVELLGPAAVSGTDEVTEFSVRRMLSTRSLTIAGGTSEVLHNVIGERILGLPR
jgi:alkylation response protein AidB-like acyl-CoA dehydrogenase